MSTKDKIIIYTNSSCPYCKQVKEELDKNNIKYTEKDTQENLDEWTDVSSLTGIPQVPTLFFKNNYFAPARDFSNEQHLVSIIKNFKNISTSLQEKVILEKIKTLNFNISMAFSRLDQTLKQLETKLNKDEHKSTD